MRKNFIGIMWFDVISFTLFVFGRGFVHFITKSFMAVHRKSPGAKSIPYHTQESSFNSLNLASTAVTGCLV